MNNPTHFGFVFGAPLTVKRVLVRGIRACVQDAVTITARLHISVAIIG